MFSQDRNDPFFREPRLLHLRLPQGDGLYPFLEEVQGLRSHALKRVHMIDTENRYSQTSFIIIHLRKARADSRCSAVGGR